MPISSSQPATRSLAPEVLVGITSLERVARAIVEGFISGRRRLLYLGFSTDVAAPRQYLPDNDLRHLDRKLPALINHLLINIKAIGTHI